MAIFNIVEVRNNTPRKVLLRDEIEKVLLSDNGAAYRKMEPMLLGNYSGSPQFDHAYAVEVLLDFDRQKGGSVATCMVANNVNRRQLWDHMRRVLERYFTFRGAVMLEPRLTHQADPEAEAEAEAEVV
jgi:hypothetical protein